MRVEVRNVRSAPGIRRYFTLAPSLAASMITLVLRCFQIVVRIMERSAADKNRWELNGQLRYGNASNYKFNPTAPCTIHGVTEVWMIYKCPVDASSDKLRAKYENAALEFLFPVENYILVVGTNSLMYLNKHCALCNGVVNYTDEQSVLWPSGLKFKFKVYSRFKVNLNSLSKFNLNKYKKKYTPKSISSRLN